MITFTLERKRLSWVKVGENVMVDNILPSN